MSSMIKKKGALSFKPKAPQIRRGAGAPPSQPSSKPRPSVDRQSQTPAPSTRPTPAFSPPPSEHSQTQASAPSTTSIANPRTTSVAESDPVPVSPSVPPEVSSTSKTVPSSESVSQGTHGFTDGTSVVARSEVDQQQEQAPLTPPPTQSSPIVHTELDRIPTSTTPKDSRIYGTTTTTIGVPETVSTDVPVLEQPIEPVTEAPLFVPQTITTHEQHSGASVVVPDATITSPSSLENAVDGTAGGPHHASIALTINNGLTNTIITPVTGTKKRPTKRKRAGEDNPGDIRPSVEGIASRARSVPKSLLPKKPRKQKETKEPSEKRPRKKRAETPEDAEEQEVDPTKMKMAELCKDLRIGRKFSKHAEIKQREVDKKVKAKLLRDHPELVAIEESRAEAAAASEAIAEEASSGVQMRVVNGQIVLDDRSLLMDRHARAAAAADVMEVVEENEFTRITTAGTHMKREKALAWDYESTEKFYMGIRMFGTDFEMISQMFPNRNRRQVKLKFNKEERERGDIIHKALLGEQTTIDFDEYKLHTGLEYEKTEDIEREYAAAEQEHADEQARVLTQAADLNRQKKAAIQGRSAASGDADGTANGAENGPQGFGLGEDGKASAASRSRKKGKGKNKKGVHSIYGGGEDIEVVGNV